VDTCNRIRLLSIRPVVFPAVIEENGDYMVASAFGDHQEGEDVFQVVRGVSNIGGDVKEDPQFGKAQFASPSEFLVDCIQIEVLPQLDLVDSIGWRVVDAGGPLEAAEPLSRLLFGPASLADSQANQE
jgi:hypothetical protein